MANPVLVIMAAGMGSRYGGLKQIDPIGPNGCPVLSGDEGRQGRENHLGKDLDGTCRRVRVVLPQLVDTGIAAAG